MRIVNGVAVGVIIRRWHAFVSLRMRFVVLGAWMKRDLTFVRVLMLGFGVRRLDASRRHSHWRRVVVVVILKLASLC